ncbi:MAG: hypothetical protein PVI66_09880 [Candidatus Aminicenantes bacterium]
MPTERSKYQAGISDDYRFCSECGTPIHSSDKAFISQTSIAAFII